MTPRPIPKDALTQVPLRDLELEAQYAQIREALARYSEPPRDTPQEGELKCVDCGTLAPEETPRCACGSFLHSHRVFTCPECARVVARSARDCARCGASFWSPVNPPAHAVTDEMVRDYLEGFERADGV